jgi:hypothetical protein
MDRIDAWNSKKVRTYASKGTGIYLTTIILLNLVRIRENNVYLAESLTVNRRKARRDLKTAMLLGTAPSVTMVVTTVAHIDINIAPSILPQKVR